MPAWGLSIFSDPTTSRNGGKSIQFESVNSTDYLLSDYINIPGEDTTYPFSLELTWKNTGGTSTIDIPSVDILWYSASKVLLSTTTVSHGAPPTSFKPSGGPPDRTVWTTSRAQGIQSPNASSRFVRLKIYFADPDDIAWIDEISMYRCARSMRAGKSNVTYGYMTLGSSWYNVAMGVVSSDPFYDRGSQFVDNSSSSVPYTGYHFLCREPGTYHFSVNANLTHVFGATTTTKTVTGRVIKNATYNSSGVWLSTGTVVAESAPLVKSWFNVTNGLTMEGTVDLVAGDTLTFNTNWSSGGAGNIVVGAGGGSITESYFLVRMHQAD